VIWQVFVKLNALTKNIFKTKQDFLDFSLEAQVLKFVRQSFQSCCKANYIYKFQENFSHLYFFWLVLELAYVFIFSVSDKSLPRHAASYKF